METKPKFWVIGITGIAGSGKDNTATLLDGLHGFRRVAIGDFIRAALRIASGPTGELEKELDADRTFRGECMTMGTETPEAILMRDTWAYAAMAVIEYNAFRRCVPRRRIVVPDITTITQNKVIGNTVRSLGGFYESWRVINERTKPVKEASHKSEIQRATLPVDFTIANNGSRWDLARGIAARLEHHGIGEE